MGVRWKAVTGIDLSENSCLAVQAVLRRGQIHYNTVMEHEGAVSRAALQGLVEFITLDTAHHKTVSAAFLEPAASFTQWLETPYTSVAKARGVMPSLLDIKLPFPVEDCVCEYALYPGKHAVNGFAAGTRKSAAQQALTRLRELGMDPAYLAHEGVVLWSQSLREEPPDKDDSYRVVAKLCENDCWICIGCGTLLHTCQRLGGWQRDADGMEHLAAGARRLLLSSGVPDGAPVDWYWCGPRVQALSDELSIVREKLQSRGPVQWKTHEAPAAFPARALAAAVLTDGYGVHMRPHDQPHPSILYRIQSARMRLMGVGCLLSLLLIAGSLAATFFYSARYEALRDELKARAEDYTGGAVQKGMELVQVRQATARREALSKPFLTAFAVPASRTLKAILNQAQAANLVLETLTIREASFQLSGASDNWDAPARFYEQLENVGLKPQSLDRQDADAAEQVRFTIQGVYP